jgi:YggT family protein
LALDPHNLDPHNDASSAFKKHFESRRVSGKLHQFPAGHPQVSFSPQVLGRNTMEQNLANAGIYLVQSFFGIYMILLMVRLLMQISRADYYNPICQGIVRVTDPAIMPFRKMLPTVKGVDLATLAVAFVVQLVAVVLIMMLYGNTLFHPLYLAWVLLGLFSTILNIYFIALIVMVIASWIAPQSNHPALSLVYQITEPVCAPARKLLPPMGGLDLSIILVFVVLNLIDNYLVIAPLAQMLQIPPGIIIGLP